MVDPGGDGVYDRDDPKQPGPIQAAVLAKAQYNGFLPLRSDLQREEGV